MSVLTLDGVSAKRADRLVLKDIDLDIVAGETVAVLGPNGAGKSTLLDVARGALTPSAGRVVARGTVATALQGADLARRTARANVELALTWWGLPQGSRPERARQALAAMGAEHLADRRAHELSGGERRRVHLARAVAVQPDVLLLDEPFAGLDSAAKASLLQDAAAAFRAGPTAVVVVVHDRAEAWALADRLVIVLDGTLAAVGAPQELLLSPPSPEVAQFLGYTGDLATPQGRLLTRPVDVLVGAGAPATVTARTPQEDRVLLDLRLHHGTLQAFVGYPGPAIGESVLVDTIGGVHFPARP